MPKWVVKKGEKLSKILPRKPVQDIKTKILKVTILHDAA